MGPYGNLITNCNLTAAKSKTILHSSTLADMYVFIFVCLFLCLCWGHPHQRIISYAIHMRLYWGPCYVYACISKTALACPFLFMFFWSLTYIIWIYIHFIYCVLFYSVLDYTVLLLERALHSIKPEWISFIQVLFWLFKQGSFLHEHARPLNKQCAWTLTTGSALIKMACLKAIIAIIFLVGLGKCARDLTKCVVCKKLSHGLNKSEVDRL